MLGPPRGLLVASSLSWLHRNDADLGRCDAEPKAQEVSSPLVSSFVGCAVGLLFVFFSATIALRGAFLYVCPRLSPSLPIDSSLTKAAQ